MHGAHAKYRTAAVAELVRQQSLEPHVVDVIANVLRTEHVGVVPDETASFGQVDLYAANSGQLADGVFDGSHARLAGHADDVDFESALIVGE